MVIGLGNRRIEACQPDLKRAAAASVSSVSKREQRRQRRLLQRLLMTAFVVAAWSLGMAMVALRVRQPGLRYAEVAAIVAAVV